VRRNCLVIIVSSALLFIGSESSLLAQSPKGAVPASLQNGNDAQIARGKQTFNDTCAGCHDPLSDTVRNGPGLKGVFAESGHKHADGTQPVHKLDEVQKKIESGSQAMPPMKGILSDDQISDVIAFLKTL